MDEIDFEYECPKCGELFCGSMPCDDKTFSDLVVCETCSHKFTLNVQVDVIVFVE
jgi:DNA-directed RNA polymerase subunit RPC12/RpoP